MSKVTVRKSIINGKILCPPSKSYSHRAIVIATLSNRPIHLENVLLSRDTVATARCCNMLGKNITILSNNEKLTSIADYAISNGVGSLLMSGIGARDGYATPDNFLNADNSGTTIRLLTSVSSFVKNGFTILTGDNSLRKRPMKDLIRSLNQLGVECYSSKSDYSPPLIVKGGGMLGGETKISGKVSSQFISSLLLSSIYAKTKVTVKVLGNQVSKPYISSTISIMKKFGVDITNEIHGIKEDDSFSQHGLFSNNNQNNDFIRSDVKNESITESYYIPNGVDYLPVSSFKIPGDFSTASLLLSSAILTEGELDISGLDFTLPQGDTNIIDILKIMGANIKDNKSTGTIKITGTSNLEGGTFNLSDTPDLLPVVAILSLKCNSPVRITGITHARYKESDRVAIIASQLPKFGAIVEESRDSLFITPPKKIKNATIDSFDDHRLFMAFFIASMASDESTIEGSESVDVSYPKFLNDMKNLGATIN